MLKIIRILAFVGMIVAPAIAPATVMAAEQPQIIVAPTTGAAAEQPQIIKDCVIGKQVQYPEGVYTFANDGVATLSVALPTKEGNMDHREYVLRWHVAEGRDIQGRSITDLCIRRIDGGSICDPIVKHDEKCSRHRFGLWHPFTREGGVPSKDLP